jgi:hypothetical protein
MSSTEDEINTTNDINTNLSENEGVTEINT